MNTSSRIQRVFKPVIRFRNQHSASADKGNGQVSSFDEIPGPSGLFNIPFIGTAFHFKPFTNYTVNTMHELFESFQQKYGDIMKFKAGKKWLLVVSHPEYARQIYGIPVKHPFRPQVDILDAYYKRNNVEPGLAVLQGEQWAALRKPAQERMLKPVAVASYVPILTAVADDFIALARKSQVIDDCLKTLVNFTTESIGMLCFNKRLGCLDRSSNIDFINHLDKFFKGIDENGRNIKPYIYFRTPLYREFEKSADYLYSVARTELKAATERLVCLKQEGKLDNSSEEPNLLYSLLSHPQMTPGKAQTMLMDLFIGGIDSTSNSLVFLWHELAKNPEKQKRLHEEIQLHIGKKDITKGSLANMPYLKACVRESMRKNFPVSPGGFRRTEEDCCVGGYHIPKQTDVIITLKNICKDERFYKNPEQFVPERFLRQDDILDDATRHTDPFAFLPFGFGPRSCIGQRFAENEIYIITTKLIQNFEISLPKDALKELEYSYRIFACPKSKVTLILRERPKSA